MSDKKRIAVLLDKLGVDYIEGGWPGSNPLDTAFFAEPPPLRARLVAFAMTVKDISAMEKALAPLKGRETVCIVGKSSIFQVKTALEISEEQNLEIISATINALCKQKSAVFFDAEHFSTVIRRPRLCPQDPPNRPKSGGQTHNLVRYQRRRLAQRGERNSGSYLRPRPQRTAWGAFS